MSALMSSTVTWVPGAAGVHHAQGDVAGAAGDIEQGEGSPSLFGGLTAVTSDVLPGAMQPARHQVVHQVVAARDRMEHVVDQPLLVGKRHLPEAEMGVLTGRAVRFLAVRHQIFLFAEHHSAPARSATKPRSGKSNRIRVVLRRTAAPHHRCHECRSRIRAPPRLRHGDRAVRRGVERARLGQRAAAGKGPRRHRAPSSPSKAATGAGTAAAVATVVADIQRYLAGERSTSAP